LEKKDGVGGKRDRLQVAQPSGATDGVGCEGSEGIGAGIHDEDDEGPSVVCWQAEAGASVKSM
jgi:hypothetical protein